MWSRLLTLEQCLDALTRIIDERDNSEAEHFVIVELAGLDHYVQFYFDEERIYAEAQGSYYLVEDDRPGLTTRQHETLLAFGWEGPADPTEPRESGGDPHGNYFREWSYDTPTETIVMELMRTLVGVYAVGEGVGVELTCSWKEI